MTDSAPSRTLIFGGTFDPPHRAHTGLARLIADTLDGARIIFIPAAINPLKQETPPTPAEYRVAMLRLAIADIDHAEVSTIELDRSGPSYFIDTLLQLRAEAKGGDEELMFLIGADSVFSFHQWKDWRAVLDLAEPVVMLRPPWSRSRFRAQLREAYGEDEAAHWMNRVVDAPLMDISATEIRRRYAIGEDPIEDLHPAVHEYILRHGLYGAARIEDGLSG